MKCIKPFSISRVAFQIVCEEFYKDAFYLSNKEKEVKTGSLQNCSKFI